MKKQLTLLLILCTLLCTLSYTNLHRSVEAASKKSYSAEDLFQKFSKSTVLIETSGGSGTGFFIEKNVVVTNNHVIAGAGWITIKTVDGKVYDVTTILASSERPDLALLKVDVKGTALKKNEHGVRDGEPVYTIGAPMGIFPCISDGIVMKRSHMDGDMEYILSNFHAIGGNSGGPVFNSYGEVMGVVVGGMADGPNSIDTVIPITYLDTLDRSNPVKVGTKEEWTKESNKLDEEKYEMASSLSKAKVGQLVSFGSYEQDGNTSNGKEDILWLVKESKDGTLTLLSLYCLDVVPYNTEMVDVTWETSSIRAFLNGEFIQNAFSKAEQKKLVTSTVVNNDNPAHGTSGGKNTKDKVYLQSLEEVMADYGINEPAEAFYGEIYAQATPYTMQKGVWLEIENSNRCWWWLRSSGGNPMNAAEVGSAGYLSFNGSNVTTRERAIRPVIKIKVK